MAKATIVWQGAGREFARLRNIRGYSRNNVIKRATKILFDRIEERMGEGLPKADLEELLAFTTGDNLARFEEGRMVKVPRQFVDLLCDAIECIPEERSRLMLECGWTPFTDSNGTVTETTVWINHIMPELRDALESILGSLGTELGKLTEQERRELFRKAVQLWSQ